MLGDRFEAKIPMQPPTAWISVKGAREHNLKNLDVRIPRDRLVVVTGLSGSGKSSLAFDTIYAEGQRRYVESLSAYARQFLEQMEKPDVERIEGLPPTISIEQRAGISSPRSTVATTTEIYDYLRLLFARAGDPHCPKCGKPIQAQTARQIVARILAMPEGTRLSLLAPIVRGRKGEYREVFAMLAKEGFPRVRVDGTLTDASSPPALDKFKKHDIAAVIDRIVVKPNLGTRLQESVELALRKGFGIAILSIGEGASARDEFVSERFACLACNVSLEEIAPRTFSFNSPYGACPACDGIGTKMEFDPDLVLPDRKRSVLESAVEPWGRGDPMMRGHYKRVLLEFCRRFRLDPRSPLEAWPTETLKILMDGQAGPPKFEGVLPHLERRFKRTESESVKRRLLEYMSELPCPKCKGARLKPEALAVKIGGRSITEISRMPIGEALAFFAGLPWDAAKEPIARPILKEVLSRLGFLRDVGLSYITLDRTTSTLSGGESQRIRLASQVGSGLVGVCYVLDEPTIGLHPRDNRRLLDTLERLRDLGNTVILVEHDEFTIRHADWVLDLGPGAGAEGGRIIAQGALPDILASRESLTGAYLSGRLSIPMPDRRRPVRPDRADTITGA
ncbi:MAG: excinuclease ABC subunit UvrA, partial [Planctomycetota bacterium]